jgi:hypothetical protein
MLEELDITSPYFIVGSEFKLPFHLNKRDDKCRQMFPQLFKNGTTKRKRESTRKGGGKG